MAPLCPLIGLAFCAIIVAAFGLLYRLPVVGFTIAGVLLFIPLTLGVLMTLLVAGLVAGWPLMVAAVAAGAEDALDAWSRTFGYLNQRIGSFVAPAGTRLVGGNRRAHPGGSLRRGRDTPHSMGSWTDRG